MTQSTQKVGAAPRPDISVVWSPSAPEREAQQWLLSFYRTSEIQGSLFFGRLAQTVKEGTVLEDLTHHYADEAQHAWYWTQCMKELDMAPLRLQSTYQDQYLDAAGIPTNLMEILALTQVFEKRVMVQYTKHKSLAGLHPAVVQTLDCIMVDERWHIQWIQSALRSMEPQYGKEIIEKTLAHYHQADAAVFGKTIEAHQSYWDVLFQGSYGLLCEEPSP